MRAYEEYFRVPVYFAGAGITFTLPEELLEAEIATANSAVFQASLALGSKAFNTRVTREMGGYRQRIVALLEVLQDRYPSIAWVARQLKVTERTGPTSPSCPKPPGSTATPRAPKCSPPVSPASGWTRRGGCSASATGAAGSSIAATSSTA